MAYMVVPKVPTITVNVTKTVLEESEPSTTGKCMVAQALRRRGYRSVNVNAERASFNLDGHRFKYDLPARVKQAIINFDDKKRIKPFQFQLRSFQGAVAPVAEHGPRKKKNKTYTRKPKKSIRNCKRRFHGLTIIQPVGK